MKYTMTTLILLGYLSLFGQVNIDFTDPATPIYGTNAQKIENVNGQNVAIMWSGDANKDGKVRYSDYFLPPFTLIPSDAIAIFNFLGGDPAAQMNGYYDHDLNMDGKVRYSDLFVPPFTFIPSDALKIFNLLGGNPAGEIAQQF